MRRYSEKLGKMVTVVFTDYDQMRSFIESDDGEQAIVATEFDLRPERCVPEITASYSKFYAECCCGQMRQEGYSTALGATQAWAAHAKNMG